MQSPDLALIHRVELLDQRCNVLCAVAPVVMGADLQIEAPQAALERAWFIYAYAADGTLIESRLSALGKAMQAMRLGPLRRDHDDVEQA